MATKLFELGQATSAGPEYDVSAAANFYKPIQEKVAALGLIELAARLEKMAEIDAHITEDALMNGLAPVFLTPDAYPIEGEASPALIQVSRVRSLIINPKLTTLEFGRACNEIGNEADLAVSKQVEDLEQLLVHPDYQPMGYIEPDNLTAHWYMPTVFDGLTLKKEIVESNANDGAYTIEDGELVALPPKYVRQLGITVYKTGSSPGR